MQQSIEQAMLADLHRRVMAIEVRLIELDQIKRDVAQALEALRAKHVSQPQQRVS